MRRRGFLQSFFGGALCLPLRLGAAETPTEQTAHFAHGVASGDPFADSIILWTRISGVVDNSIEVHWKVARDVAMQRVLRSGKFSTGAFRDYTVKVDAEGLPAATDLYYQFEIAGEEGNARRSPIGRTRTLPAGPVASATLAVVSCANYPAGYFHVYREIAQQENLAAVVHLGDYLYEYGLGEYATERATALGREPDPQGETITLSDLRRRHAQYKTDPDLQAMHAAHPMIAVWDDHEFCNDAWRDGAQNQQANEGSWPERRDAAIQAWLEWMPVRASHEREATRIFRKFDFGDLCSLLMLDTRLYGRDQQPDVGDEVSKQSIETAMRDPSRGLLGEEQSAWMRKALAGWTRWQLIGQQVMVSPTLSPELEPLLDSERESMLSAEQLQYYIEMSKGNPPMLLDTWNGYPVARERFLQDIAKHAQNPVVLSGDLHTSMAGNLFVSDRKDPVAVEFMTGSVSSPGFAEYLPEIRPGAVRDATLELNPSLVYMETDRRGWLRLTLDHEKCTGEWQLLSGVHEKEYTVSTDQRLFVRAGQIDRGLQVA
jgi:alkaline phosphatase D